jgi:hypothetical protein
MSAKLIVIVGVVTIVAGGVLLYFLRSPSYRVSDPGPQIADNAAAQAYEATDVRSEAIGESLESATPSDAEVHEIESTNAREPLVYERPLSAFEMTIGRNYADCRRKPTLTMDVCKHWFERRDDRWASATEARIEELVSATPLIRLSANPRQKFPNVECRTTWCRIYLDVDLAALIDHQRSIGQWDDKWEHKFFAATGTGGGWNKDRSEELRLGLVMSGLIEADAEIEINAMILAGDSDQDGLLEVYVHRCPKRFESCVPH